MAIGAVVTQNGFKCASELGCPSVNDKVGLILQLNMLMDPRNDDLSDVRTEYLVCMQDEVNAEWRPAEA